MNKSSQNNKLQYAKGNCVRAADGSEWLIRTEGESGQKWTLVSFEDCFVIKQVTKSRLKKYYTPFIEE